jgi:two-component system chemotaxis response regulator CheY
MKVMNVDIRYFYEDAFRQLKLFENIMYDIKNGTKNKAKISELFRILHTIKGSADIVNLKDIVLIAYKSEDLLDKIRDEKIIFSSSIGTLFVDIKDYIVYLVDTLENKNKAEISNKSVLLLSKIDKHLIIKKEIKMETVKKQKTILIVDDASMIRNLVSKAAEEAGYNVVSAEDGLDGLEKIKENHIDFIFSDINMPQMGGLEMVAKIRKNSTYEFIPIVMLTTEKKEELKLQGKALGVKAWLVKPFNKKKLLTVLEKLLG